MMGSFRPRNPDLLMVQVFGAELVFLAYVRPTVKRGGNFARDLACRNVHRFFSLAALASAACFGTL